MEMDKFDNIGENEIRIIGKDHIENQTNLDTLDSKDAEKNHKRRMKIIAVTVGVILLVVLLLWLFAGSHQKRELDYGDISKHSKETNSWVEISDTIINDISLHRFIPVNARPKLVVGLIKQIPKEYILGAMAADFGLYDEKYQVVGGFVHHGEMLSHSKSKYGFCALLKDTIVIGNALSTSFFEQAIEEKGDFFRQYALVKDSEVVHNPPTHNDALRRSLCRLSDGRVCIIDTDMSVSLDSFSTALRQYGIIEAVALMGSGAAVRWAVDKAGRRYIAGADEYEFPNVVNYIVWEKEEKEDVGK